MARRSTEVEFDPEVHKAPTIDLDTVEIKGRDPKWSVFYPGAENISSKVLVYDQDGRLKETVDTWVATNKLTECHETFSTLEEAQAFAEAIMPGCKIKVTHISKRGEHLKKGKDEDN